MYTETNSVVNYAHILCVLIQCILQIKHTKIGSVQLKKPNPNVWYNFPPIS